MGEGEELKGKCIISAIKFTASNCHTKVGGCSERNITKLLEIAKDDREYLKLIRIAQRGCLEKKNVWERIKEFQPSLIFLHWFIIIGTIQLYLELYIKYLTNFIL